MLTRGAQGRFLIRSFLTPVGMNMRHFGGAKGSTNRLQKIWKAISMLKGPSKGKLGLDELDLTMGNL